MQLKLSSGKGVLLLFIGVGHTSEFYLDLASWHTNKRHNLCGKLIFFLLNNDQIKFYHGMLWLVLLKFLIFACELEGRFECPYYKLFHICCGI